MNPLVDYVIPVADYLQVTQVGIQKHTIIIYERYIKNLLPLQITSFFLAISCQIIHCVNILKS
jgi:hypothetical protein